MRLLLKIILFPITLIFSVIILFLQFILGISTIVLNIISGLVVIGSFAALFQKDMTTFLQAIVIAFLLSPYGLPMIGAIIVGLLEEINFAIRSI